MNGYALAYPPAKKRPDAAHLSTEITEAMSRGREKIAAAQQALASNPASSATRRAAEAAAQRRNQPAIEAMKQRFCRTGKI